MNAPPFTLLVGDVMEQLATLPDESVHCVVTSPPYWGLRDYGTADWQGGDPACPHRVGGQVADGKAGAAITAGVRPGVDASRCIDCGAERVDLQLGLEPTPELYVDRMVGVFREVRRVLRADGTLWLNVGDSYASSGGDDRKGSSDGRVGRGDRPAERIRAGLKPKDLVGIPWMLAFALRADGWYLRRDNIWHKPNPMPESAEDRPTSAHEYLFLMTKKPHYFYDNEAVKEPLSEGTLADPRLGKQSSLDATPYGSESGKAAGLGHGPRGDAEGRNKRSVWEVSAEEYAADLAEVLTLLMDARGERTDVWKIATEPYPDAHFATFPTKLVEPCILAGTSERGCCPECGAPWQRVTERVDKGWDGSTYGERAVDATGGALTGGTVRSTLGSSGGALVGGRRTVAWEPMCDCETTEVEAPHGLRPDGPHEPIPCTVLDPFGGSGTTALVARRLGRASVIVELNPEYAALAEKRLAAWWKKPQHVRVDLPSDQLALPLPA